MMSVRFELFVNDTKETSKFYTNILGISIKKHGSSDEDSYVELVKGNVVIGLGSLSQLPVTHPLNPQDSNVVGKGIEIVF